ncbi:MAG: SHD1 domain-containing protein, partial [Planctomycetota bacterium]
PYLSMHRKLRVSLLCLSCLLVSSELLGADTFRPGESVAFVHEDAWQVGKVVQVDRGRVMVSATVDGETMQGVFLVAALRRPPWTVGDRFWSDPSGQFRIKASVVDVAETALRLLKTDGEAITVPIARLSEQDRQIASKLVAAKQRYDAARSAKEGNPEEGLIDAANRSSADRNAPSGSIPSMSASNAGLASLVAPGSKPERTIELTQEPKARQVFFKPRTTLYATPADLPLTALPIGEPLQAVPPGARVSYQAYRDEAIERIRYVGGDGAWVLLEVKSPAERVYGKAVRWASLQSGAVTPARLLPKGEEVVAVEPNTGRFLTKFFDGTDATNPIKGYRVYRCVPPSFEPTFECWLTPTTGEVYIGPAVPSFLPGNRLLLHGAYDLHVVDLSSGEKRWSMDYGSVTQGHSQPQVSPDRRYLRLTFRDDAPEKRLIIDLQNYQFVHCTPIPDRTFEAFSQDGKWLVSLQGQDLLWYDTQTWEVTRRQRNNSKWAGSGSCFHVLGQRYLIDGQKRILDLETGEISGQASGNGVPHNPHMPPESALIGDRIVVASSDRTTKSVISISLP